MTHPADSELELLKLFWRAGPMSAREVHERLPPELGWTISTTRTLLERMRAKGLLSRRSVHGLAVYAPAQDKVQVIGGFLRRVVRDFLEVEGALPASTFLGSQILSRQELDALTRLLNEAETEPRKSGEAKPE